ncbi:hypothetical protein B7486_77055, partial [cyanobacterium TDX16]
MSEVLQGRAAIVTGASQGLGLAIARAYVEGGANVLVCARNAALLDEEQRELQALAQPGQVILAEAADVANAEDVARVTESAIRAFGQVQILVNNAG